MLIHTDSSFCHFLEQPSAMNLGAGWVQKSLSKVWSRYASNLVTPHKWRAGPLCPLCPREAIESGLKQLKSLQFVSVTSGKVWQYQCAWARWHVALPWIQRRSRWGRVNEGIWGPLLEIVSSLRSFDARSLREMQIIVISFSNPCWILFAETSSNRCVVVEELTISTCCLRRLGAGLESDSSFCSGRLTACLNGESR